MFAFERQIFKQNCYYSKQNLIYYNLLYKQFGLLFMVTQNTNFLTTFKINLTCLLSILVKYFTVN